MTLMISLQQFSSGLWNYITNPSDVKSAQNFGDNEYTFLAHIIPPSTTTTNTPFSMLNIPNFLVNPCKAYFSEL